MNDSSQISQRQLFDAIGENYLCHYNDPESTAYRKEFIYTPLVKGVDMAGKRVLDAMCGSGQLSEFLIKESCRLHALDLSEQQISLYKQRFPSVPTLVRSILDTGFPDNWFDVVLVFGGLHHVHPHVASAVREIRRILKPGGYFLLGEPHACSLVDRARQLWYKKDPLFMDNEASIDYSRLRKDFAKDFDVEYVGYFGNLAYYLVYNSLILRVPLSVKRRMAPMLLSLETFLTPWHTHFFSSYMIARWRKK